MQPVTSKATVGICFAKARSKDNECTRKDCQFRHDFSSQERVDFLVAELAKTPRAPSVHSLDVDDQHQEVDEPLPDSASGGN